MQPNDLQALFESQRSRRWQIAGSSTRDRIEKLTRLRKEIMARRDEIVQALHADFRKCAAETEFTEINTTLEELKLTIDSLPAWMEPRRVPTPIMLLGTRSEIRYEPLGQVLILSPWNYPFNLLMVPLAAAVAAGNCVIARPSEKVPATSQVIARIVTACFDPSEVAVVVGGVELAEALVELPFDHFFFTGSTRIGRHIAQKAAAHLATTTLELGGKSPVIIDPSADLAHAGRRIAWGKFVNAGQTCIAPDHAWVPAGQVHTFAAHVVQAFASFGGASEDDRRRSPDFARMIDVGAVRRLRNLVESSIAQGAKLECGGVFDDEERYIAPTVLTGVTPSMPVMQEELFGPILPVLAYRDASEVRATLQGGDGPLALYVFSTDDKATENWLRASTAGGSVINDVLLQYGNPHLPFGGVGQSGQGNYHGFASFRTMSHERAVMDRGAARQVSLLEPPYDAPLANLAQKLGRYLA